MSKTKEKNQGIPEENPSPADIAVLGMMVGEVRYLVRMKEISEVIPVSSIVPVPLTHSWFLGIINLHGNLYGITDLGVYLGDESISFGSRSRILLISPQYRINSGFIVHNLLGIRNLSEFTPCQVTENHLRNGVSHVYNDQEGRIWYELDLYAIVREKHFLQIAC